ncbi:type I-E CRISPR-associated protein Cas7/Cse4/CasC [Jatrophihabitans lederbergiae]|uniref:Type I-E CRISPR-associated protein Cas7/Cse4/CasC n=1 Tax=Jatrophihabitans lederbergiae TaxID=3075547 RepID=A0ABU2J507_9ACTN|nr:type I-E CRISPR-associated protein Cas7/Cse4/CasC [Jatrophihabitans sp. DSM 44399]MDT0260062.1 type I-E CRISPR-associated protein Cas7/Cse4/CasC [Jatrophihabitans sp. DSM 44399]
MTTTRSILDVHVIQTVPPSNLNRDDSGSPKSAMYGGVRRARVSSQSWKRAIRLDFTATLAPSEVGVRTKRLVEMVAEAMVVASPDTEMDDALDMAADVLNAAGIGNKVPKKARKTESDKSIAEADALAFLSIAQVQALAAYALEVRTAGGKPEKKTAIRLADTQHSIDIALFGRMVASNPDLNTDAACQVAHALSTHPVATEFDYYTAVDERKPSEESGGAGMLGVIEFNSATLYRYATLDVDRLAQMLGESDVTVAGAQTFLRSMLTSMPSGKQNTFANRTLPDAVVITLRCDQSISYVGAFETPVTSTAGRITASAVALAEHATDMDGVFGMPPVQTWVIARSEVAQALSALGARQPMTDVLAEIGSVLAARLAG